MFKKVTTYIIATLLLILSASLAFADEKTPPPSSSKSGNFSKGNFSNKNAWSNNQKASTPPNPAGTGSDEGNRIPISNGVSFLLIASTVYFYRKHKKENN